MFVYKSNMAWTHVIGSEKIFEKPKFFKYIPKLVTCVLGEIYSSVLHSQLPLRQQRADGVEGIFWPLRFGAEQLSAPGFLRSSSIADS